MRLPSEGYQMQQSIEQHMPHLRESQLKGLVLWVYGAILAGSGCQNAVATALSFIGSFNTASASTSESGSTTDKTAPTRAECNWT